MKQSSLRPQQVYRLTQVLCALAFVLNAGMVFAADTILPQDPFAIKMKDGTTIVGTIKNDVLKFSATYGDFNVVPAEIVRLKEGLLTLRDRSVLKGAFSGETVLVGTSRGIIKLPLIEVLNIDKPQSESTPQSTIAGETRTPRPPSNNRDPIPDYYGLHAFSQNRLIEMKTGGVVVSVGADVEFIYYAKSVSAAEMFGLFELPSPSKPVPTKLDGKFKGWDDFLKQSQEHSEVIQGQINGLPRGSVQVELRARSVPDQPEMIRLSPASRPTPGEYQIGIRGGSWFRFSVPGSPQLRSRSSTTSSPQTTQRFGPSLKTLSREVTQNQANVIQVGPKIQKNSAWPVVERAVQAHGGAHNLLRMNATKVRVRGKTFIPSEGFVETETTFYAYRGQLRQETNFQLKQGAVNQILAYSAGNARGFQNGGSFPVSSETKENFKREIFVQGVESFRPLLEDKFQVSNDGDVSVGGKAFHSITVLSADKDAVTLLFDPESGLLFRRRSERKDPKGKLLNFEVVYSNYSENYGVMTPGHIEAFENGELKGQTDVLSVTGLESIPDVYFTDLSLAVPRSD